MVEGNTVVTERDDDVLVVTINRPDVRNAVDAPTAAALHEAFAAFDADGDLGVAVLTGANGTFCAGADLKAIAEEPERMNRAHRDGPGPLGPTRMLLSKPVIAAVEGHAVAGGLELALWCDMRVAATDAVFGVFCRRWGVPLMDGGTVRLPRLIGHSHALDLILTGRGVSGDEALQMGLANRLAEPRQALDEALALARDITRFPQLCLRMDRRSSYEQWSLDMQAALVNEYECGWSVLESGETVAGASRFASGRGRHGDFADL